MCRNGLLVLPTYPVPLLTQQDSSYFFLCIKKVLAKLDGRLGTSVEELKYATELVWFLGFVVDTHMVSGLEFSEKNRKNADHLSAE